MLEGRELLPRAVALRLRVRVRVRDEYVLTGRTKAAARVRPSHALSRIAMCRPLFREKIAKLFGMR